MEPAVQTFSILAPGDVPALTPLPLRPPGPGEVQLRLAAASLNFADLLLAEGRYQERPPHPVTLGLEGAGTVAALGSWVEGPPVGTRVAVAAVTGTLAEAGCFPATRVWPIPDAMPFEVAAALPIAHGTSHLALTRRAGLAAGETLLVTGAAGGVGLTAVEIGHRLGARVIASARGAERLEVAREAGADHLIDSEAPGLREALRDLGGVDVVYDTVGGPAFLDALRATRPEGRLLAIGFAGGEVPQVPANLLLVKNLSVTGFYWGAYADLDPAAWRGSLQTLTDWNAQGLIAPRISHRLPLARAAEGLDLLRARRATGKVVVTIPC